MTFSVKQAVADLDLPPFPYEDAAGKAQQLPHVKMLSPAQAYRVLAEGAFAEVINELAPGQGDAIADLPSAVIEELFAAWMGHSEIELGSLGKPARPSRSTSSTGTRSKPTSRSRASRSTR